MSAIYALSVRQPYAGQIANGTKPIEIRSRQTPHRGPLVILATQNWDDGEDPDDYDGKEFSCGVAVCEVTLTAVKLRKDGQYNWHLANPKPLEQVKVKGHQGSIFRLPPRVIKKLGYPVNDGELQQSEQEWNVPLPSISSKRSKLTELSESTAGRVSRGKRALHEHQSLAVEKIRAWIEEGRSTPGRNGYLEMPTGSGKTFTTVAALAASLERGERVLWIAHNRYLLDQAQKTFERQFGEKFVIGRLQGRQRPDSPIVLATVQTLCANDCRSLGEMLKDRRPQLVVFDEFHRSAADQWKRVVDSLHRHHIPVLGISATPTRTTAEKTQWLRKRFPEPVFVVGLEELVRDGILAKPSYLRIDVKAPKLRWSAEEMRHHDRFHEVPESVLKRLAKQESRNRQIIATFKDHPGSPRAIAFCCSVDHAVELARQFRKSGVRAEAVTGQADRPENRQALEAFRKGELDVLTSVVLLTEGVDLPTCDTVLLGRPTESEVLLKQMMGRAMRGPKMGGNETCRIIDFVDAFANVAEIARKGIGIWSPADQTRERLARRNRTGVELAVLLRLREWFAGQPVEGTSGEIFVREIYGVFEFFDEVARINRALLVPEAERAALDATLTKISEILAKDPSIAQHPVRMAALARQMLASNFPNGTRLSEEDMVALLLACQRKEELPLLRRAEDILEDLRSSPILDEKTALTIANVDKIAAQLR